MSIFLIPAILFSQEEEEEIQSEEEIWAPKQKQERKRREDIKKKEEEEEIIPGAFEYADEKDKTLERKRKQEESKTEKKVEEKEAQTNPILDGGTRDAGEEVRAETPRHRLEDETDTTNLKLPEFRLNDLASIWFERLNHLKKRDFVLADEKLKKIIEEKLNSGIPNIPPISLSLIIEAKNSMRAKDFVTAQKLADAAMIISPDIYEVWFFKAYLHWVINKTDIVRPLKFFLGGLKRIITTINTGPLVIGNIITLISLIISVTALLFIIALLLKNASRILHDLSHLFPPGRSTFFSDIIWLTLFLTLIIRFLSIFHFFFISSIVLWLYLKKREKIALIILIIFISILPYNFSIYNQMLNLFKGNSQYIYKAFKFEEEQSIEKLKSLIDSGGAGTDEYVAYGLINKRRGNFELAERLYKKAIEINASNVVAYNNLGNLYIITERYDDALIQFNNALNLEPQSATIRFNISRLFLRKKELDKSNAELSEAKRYDEELVGEILKKSSSNINRFIYDMEPNYNIDLLQILKNEGATNKRIYLPFEHYITGGILTSDVLFWLIIMTITIVGVGLLSRYVHISNICHRCGKPVCRYCSPELYNDDECSQCFHIFTKRDVADPKNRFLKDKEISNYQFIHNITSKILSFVIPGTIHLTKGMPIKGLLILLFSVTGFISYFFFNRPNPLPYFSTTPLEIILKSPFVLAGLIAYAINIKACFPKE